MDTHIVNAVLTGSKSKSSLIESISCSSKIIPDELDTDSSSSTNLDWVKLQRADPNLSVIVVCVYHLVMISIKWSETAHKKMHWPAQM